MNPHLALAPVTAGAPPGRARLGCVLVHGREQDEAVMLDVIERLGLADVGYVMPLAAGRSWYPGRYFDPLASHEPHLGWAIEACEAAIELLGDRGLPSERIAVGGFSQGACVIAEMLARRPRRFAAAAVLTGSLLGRADERAVPAPLGGLPMFLASSRYDDWVAIDDAEATARAFARAGAAVVFESLEDRVHHVSDRAVAGLRGLLAAGA